MAILHWRDTGGAILPGGSFKTGKRVVLSGEGYTEQPSTFTVYRRFGPLLRRFREWKGKPSISAVGQPVTAEEAGANGAQGGPWVLRTPGYRLKWHVFFEDDLLNRSAELDISRLGTFGPSIGAAVDPVTFRIEVPITAAIDPLVTISIRTPWGESKDDFDQYIGELAEDAADTGDDIEATFGALREYLGRYLPSEAPEGWEFAMERNEFELEEGESAIVQITVHAPTPGATAFAIQMTAMIDGEEMIVASDPMVVQVPEDWRYASLLFGGDDDAGGGSEFGVARRDPIRPAVEFIPASELTDPARPHTEPA
jgi:hypothetical protein